MLNDDRCSDKKYYWKYTFLRLSKFFISFYFFDTISRARFVLNGKIERERERIRNTTTLFVCKYDSYTHIIDKHTSKNKIKDKALFI